MNSRAFQFQLQAAEAAAAPVHAADEYETEPPIPMPLQLKLVAQATADAPPPLAQGQGMSGVAPASVGKPEIIKCPECPKWFTSEKAMFGHLRKHPERGYKGATRPATASATTTAVAGDKKWKKQVVWKEADVSAMNMMTAAAAAAAATDEDEEAAMILLEMASSSRSTTSETQQESVQQVSAVHNQTQDVVQPMLVDHVAGHRITTPEAEQIVQPEIVLELSAESQTTPAPVKELTNLEITTKAVLIVVPANKKPIAPSPGTKKQAKKRPAQLDLEHIIAAASSPAPPEGADGKPAAARRIPSPASNKKHVCPTCAKSFPSYQALGGHMSSHVKGKQTGARHDELAVAQAAVENILAHRCQQSAGSSVVPAAASTGSGAADWVQGLNLQLQDVVVPPAPTVAVAQSAAAPASPHVCTQCQMIFPSGQALGGHKRKHWFPEKHQAKAAAAELLAAAPAPAEEAAPAEIAAPASASVARDFDLNELPEEGEGESDQP